MRKYTEHCDLCEIELKHKSDKNGYCVEVGFSPGGWGSRGNIISKMTITICNGCFKQVEVKSLELRNIIESLRPNNCHEE